MRLQYIICHYGEIGLKGENRPDFENKLAVNIRRVLDTECPGCLGRIKIISNRVLITLNETAGRKTKVIVMALENIFGIVNFALAAGSEQAIEQLRTDAWEFVKEKKFSTFRVSAQRADKNFPLTSPEINGAVGAYIVEKSGRGVRLKKPGLNIFIELFGKRAYIYTKKIKGPGGLPVGSSGRTAILMSGGIDSPVAAYYLLKRGSQVIFIHFHSRPFTSNESVEKVRALATALKKYGASGRLYLVPFADAQKETVAHAPEKLRVVLYRRLMLRIASIIAGREHCLALVTGDSLGQVASQTLENMAAVEEAVNLPVLRPLIGLDKEEIMTLARRIGTYDISIRPHDDCCVRFIPKHPETKARLAEIKKAETLLNTAEITENAIKNSEVVMV
jgi:tRNA uracil 4-sulfurtransferase